jgi:hypothetical protein
MYIAAANTQESFETNLSFETNFFMRIESNGSSSFFSTSVLVLSEDSLIQWGDFPTTNPAQTKVVTIKTL